MSKIVELDTVRKKKETENKLEAQGDFKALYGIEVDDDQLAQKLRCEKRKEKGLKWD